jgi:hypothetical protein
VLFKGVGNFIFLFLWPAIAAIFLVIVGVSDIPSLGPVVDGVGLGLLAVGVIPMLWGHLALRNSFYQGRREVFTSASLSAMGGATASTED